jgi:hypothetical protein
VKDGKLFGKINLIDLLVILLIIGVVAGTVYRFSSPEATVSPNKQIDYLLKIEGVRPFTEKFYEVGLDCYDNKTGTFIGEIAGVRVEPYESLGLNSDGTMTRVAHPTYVTIYVSVWVNGRETNNSLYANESFTVKAGGKIDLATKYVSVAATVDSVKATDI